MNRSVSDNIKKSQSMYLGWYLKNKLDWTNPYLWYVFPPYFWKMSRFSWVWLVPSPLGFLFPLLPSTRVRRGWLYGRCKSQGCGCLAYSWSFAPFWGGAAGKHTSWIGWCRRWSWGWQEEQREAGWAGGKISQRSCLLCPAPGAPRSYSRLSVFWPALELLLY